MDKIIKNLRQQSEENRRHILHVIVVIFGFILLFIWVYSLGVNLTSVNTQKKVKEDFQPFITLKENITNGYKSISGAGINAQ